MPANYSRPGVLEANWVEELAGVDLKAAGRTLLGFGEPHTANSTQRLAFNTNVSTLSGCQAAACI